MTGEELLKEMPKDPKHLDKWIVSQALQTYLIKEKDILICSRCGKTYKLKSHVKHNQKVYCQKCGSQAVVKNKELGRKMLTEYGRVLWFTKKRDSIYAKLALYEINFEGVLPTVAKIVTDIYKFNAKEQLRFQYKIRWYGGWGYHWEAMIRVAIPGLSTGGNSFGYGNKYDRELIYDCNFDIFKDSCLKYADVKQFHEDNRLSFKGLVNYIRDSLKYQSIEILRKAGFKRLVLDRIKECSGIKNIYWQGKELKKILRVADMNEVRKLRGASLAELQDYKMLKKAGIVCKSIQEVKNVISFFGYRAEKNVLELSRIIELRRAIKYLKKQSEKLGKRDLARTYIDYLDECKKLEYNIKDKSVLFPKDLGEAHARTSAQIKILASEKENEAIKVKAEILKELNWEYQGLIIRAAETAAEIINEGKEQKHCVGRYVGKVANGNSNIFFVRTKNEPEKAYYTVELILDSIGYHFAQCRGYKNRDMTEEVQNFVDKWLKEVVAKGEEKQRSRAA